MNDQLDRAVHSVLADIVHTAPQPPDQPARLLTIDEPATTRRRPVLAAAAAVIAVAGIGGVALLSGRGAAPTPAAQPESPAVLAFATPTVRLSADSVEVIVGANVFTPTAATVDFDPGSADYTTLELSWSEGGAERRLYMYFASDGSSWWADQVRTSDAAGEWIDSPEGERWFTSPLGTAWTGDVDLPNLRIRNMSIEAFLRPAACDNPTSPIAVVSAYPTIVGVAGPGLGFGGRIDLIDTATCTPVDPSPYRFEVVVADPSIAEVVSSGPTPTTTTPGEPTAPQQDGRFDLAFRSPGETTVRVTVTDGDGNVIGTTAIPITVQAATESSPADTTSTVAPEAASPDLHSQIEYRVPRTTELGGARVP